MYKQRYIKSKRGNTVKIKISLFLYNEKKYCAYLYQTWQPCKIFINLFKKNSINKHKTQKKNIFRAETIDVFLSARIT